MQQKYARGFTLIELLVVIAIIGVLASIVLASLDSARKKGRDARRIADVKQLQLALELAYDAGGAYPLTLDATSLVTPGYISVIPKDPLSGGTSYPYVYTPYTAISGSAICSSYHLGTDLETSGSASLSNDADAVVGVSPSAGETNPAGLYLCSGGSADFHGTDSGKCAGADPGVTCYDVRP